MKALEPEVIEAIRTSLDRGETGISIARRLGISKSAVSRIRTGNRHGGRLSRTQRAEIRLLVQQGMQQKAAALRYEVSEATISRICKESFATIPAGATDAPTT
jgi:predicted DNA-binding protein (UPF0251 family)